MIYPNSIYLRGTISFVALAQAAIGAWVAVGQLFQKQR